MQLTPWDPEGATAILDTQGQLSDQASVNGLDLKSYYKLLVCARHLDMRLARESLPMWASAAGEEAPLVATALAAGQHDWIYPGTRDATLAMARGLDFASIVAQVRGKGPGGGSALAAQLASTQLNVATVTDALGMHLAFAVGLSHGQKLSGSSAITFALCGEGTTTTGAFHEATMTAAMANLPIVFVCRSQIWPNGAPAEAGLVGDSVADRARSRGLWVRRVDGADPIVVHAAIAAAADRARDRRGPGLVEVVVTQMAHNPPAHRDPIERLRRYLDASGQWTQTYQDVIEAEVRGNLERAFSTAEGRP